MMHKLRSSFREHLEKCKFGIARCILRCLRDEDELRRLKGESLEPEPRNALLCMKPPEPQAERQARMDHDVLARVLWFVDDEHIRRPAVSVAACALVCKSWYPIAMAQLYGREGRIAKAQILLVSGADLMLGLFKPKFEPVDLLPAVYAYEDRGINRILSFACRIIDLFVQNDPFSLDPPMADLLSYDTSLALYKTLPTIKLMSHSLRRLILSYTTALQIRVILSATPYELAELTLVSVSSDGGDHDSAWAAWKWQCRGLKKLQIMYWQKPVLSIMLRKILEPSQATLENFTYANCGSLGDSPLGFETAQLLRQDTTYWSGIQLSNLKHLTLGYLNYSDAQAIMACNPRGLFAVTLERMYADISPSAFFAALPPSIGILYCEPGPLSMPSLQAVTQLYANREWLPNLYGFPDLRTGPDVSDEDIRGLCSAILDAFGRRCSGYAPRPSDLLEKGTYWRRAKEMVMQGENGEEEWARITADCWQEDNQQQTEGLIAETCFALAPVASLV